jgi:hypothetical protein
MTRTNICVTAGFEPIFKVINIKKSGGAKSEATGGPAIELDTT